MFAIRKFLPRSGLPAHLRAEFVLACALALALFCTGSARAAQEADDADDDAPPPARDNFIGPQMHDYLNKKSRTDLPIEHTSTSEIPGPQVAPQELDPDTIPDAPPAVRNRIQLLPKPGGGLRPPVPPRDPPRAIDPLVASLFPGQKHSDYVGDVDCFGCHQDKRKDWRRNIYGLIHYDRSISPERRGCEGCHGPGSQHVNLTGDWTANPAKLDRRRINKLCMSCHAEERLIRRQSWHFTDHNESNVTCLDCHSVHKPVADHSLSAQPDALCFRCHRDQESYFFMTSHHPVAVEMKNGQRNGEEGKVKCIDCHQVYSARNPRNLRGDKAEACLACHAEFRGPFLFQHGGGNEVLSDGCMTCHVPHGSPNQSLFRRPDRGLCLTCHTDRLTHFPGPSCFSAMGCHNDIHGSNQNRLFIGTTGSLGSSASPLQPAMENGTDQ